MVLKEGLFDSHCHLNSFADTSSAESYLNRAEKAGIEEIWDIATDLESSRKSVELARYSSKVRSFVGIDPELFVPGSEMFKGMDSKLIPIYLKELEELIIKEREFVFGIGETGMDNYWILEQDSDTQKVSLKLQEQLFRGQIELSKKFNLPLSIHSRNYETQCLEILKSEKTDSAIFHSYTGTYEVAKKILDAGFMLGVNGIVTFKTAYELRDTYKKILGEIPSGVGPKYFYDKGILFETDAPFLAPDGKRGEQNEPANIRNIYESFVNHLSL